MQFSQFQSIVLLLLVPPCHPHALWSRRHWTVFFIFCCLKCRQLIFYLKSNQANNQLFQRLFGRQELFYGLVYLHTQMRFIFRSWHLCTIRYSSWVPKFSSAMVNWNPVSRHCRCYCPDHKWLFLAFIRDAFSIQVLSMSFRLFANWFLNLCAKVLFQHLWNMNIGKIGGLLCEGSFVTQRFCQYMRCLWGDSRLT